MDGTMKTGAWAPRLRLASLMCLALAAGCGPSGDSDSKTTTRPLRLQAFGDPAELVAYKELITAFEATAPDVKVEFIPVGRQPDHMT